MSSISLQNIKIVKLKKFPTDGGDVLHFIKDGDVGFKNFGEVYFSNVKYGKVKAWKKHLKMTMNLVVPLGEVKFVFHLPESKNKFRVENIGLSNYSRIIVPPGIWFGFKGLSKNNNLVSNLANIKHDPQESINVEKNFFSYKW